MERSSLTRYAWLSIATALGTMGIKAVAWALTGSVGLLADALESTVNLVGGVMALSMLTIAARPPDDDHAFGHSKAEYFSAVVEGTLVLLAAVTIGVAAVRRLLAPQALEQVGVGLAVSVVAALANLAAALVLRRAGRRHESITLVANARHLLTDVWTTGGVLVGVGAAGLTGRLWLDPIVALLVAGNIVWTGLAILRESVSGLMDAALPAAERAAIQAVLARYEPQGVEFHALRTRRAGPRRFASVHVLVPGEWTVQRGHELLERLEADLRRTLPSLFVLTHLEPLDDPISWADVPIDRPAPPPAAQDEPTERDPRGR
jgi:cation diffusion facilitator family transporter